MNRCVAWVAAAVMGITSFAGVERFGDWTLSDQGGSVQVAYRGQVLVTRIGAGLFKSDYSKMLYSTQGATLRREGDAAVFRAERPNGTVTFTATPDGKRVVFRLDCSFTGVTGAFEYGFHFPLASYVFNENPPFMRCGGRFVGMQKDVKFAPMVDASVTFETPTRRTVFSRLVKDHVFTLQDVREKDGSGCVRYISSDRFEDAWTAHFEHELVVEDDYDEAMVAARRRAFSQLSERRTALPLANPGFEHDKADGWHFHSNMSIDETVAHTGLKSAKVVYGPGSGGHVYLTREIPVRGGARYDASVWVKTADVREAEIKPGCCGAGLIVEWLDRNGKWLAGGEYACDVFDTKDWQLKRCTNLVAPENAGFAEIYLTLRAHGTAWFDDLSFSQVFATTDKIAPALGATLADNTPFFSWRHGRCVRRYRMELSRDPAFPADATRVYDAGGLSEFQLREPLEPGVWHWRVAGPGMEDAGPWSFRQTAPKDRDCVPPQIRSRAARVTAGNEVFRLVVDEQAPGAAPVVTFRGPSFSVTGVKARDLGKGAREYVFPAPAGGWPRGVVEGTIVAVDAAGNRNERPFWLCNAPKPANHTFVRKDGYWECGGRRFTPLGIYEVAKKYMREVRAAGFDVVHTYRWESDQNDAACRDYLDACWAADGLRAFIGFDRRSIVKGEYGHVARRVGTLADHPGLFCWYLFDEPELPDQFVSPDQLTAYADLVRELDPYHTVVMTTWNKSMCEYRRTWDTHWSQAYGKPVEVVDLVEKQRRDIGSYSPITLLVNCNDGMQGRARRRGVVPDPAKFARDYDHLRACAFLALPLECNGVFWWWFARDDMSFYSASQVPKAWADLASIAHELAALRPVIDAEGPCRIGEAKDGTKRVLWWAKTVDGRTTFIAVNTANESATVRIEAPGVPAQEFAFRRHEVKVLRH